MIHTSDFYNRLHKHKYSLQFIPTCFTCCKPGKKQPLGQLAHTFINICMCNNHYHCVQNLTINNSFAMCNIMCNSMCNFLMGGKTLSLCAIVILCVISLLTSLLLNCHLCLLCAITNIVCVTSKLLKSFILYSISIHLTY